MGSEEKIPDSNWQEFTIFLGVINVSPRPNNLQFKKDYYDYDDHSDQGPMVEICCAKNMTNYLKRGQGK